jgi:hypothetical protein
MGQHSNALVESGRRGSGEDVASILFELIQGNLNAIIIDRDGGEGMAPLNFLKNKKIKSLVY